MGNAKQLRKRIRSVDSTMHITKAMEIVASSKLKKAMTAMSESRAYFDALQEVFASVAGSREKSIFIQGREIRKTCLIVIAGDRGLAGGYNNNIFKRARALSEDKNICVVPIGKKALEHFKRRKYEIYSEEYHSSEHMSVELINALGKRLIEDYSQGVIDEIKILYTSYNSILSQEVAERNILPLKSSEGKAIKSDMQFEPSCQTVLNTAIPQYISGIIYGAVCESFVSELSSRRNAMNSANKNAKEMIDNLSLEYNRARQSAITQEITEIVAGS